MKLTPCIMLGFAAFCYTLCMNFSHDLLNLNLYYILPEDENLSWSHEDYMSDSVQGTAMITVQMNVMNPASVSIT